MFPMRRMLTTGPLVEKSINTLWIYTIFTKGWNKDIRPIRRWLHVPIPLHNLGNKYDSICVLSNVIFPRGFWSYLILYLTLYSSVSNSSLIMISMSVLVCISLILEPWPIRRFQRPIATLPLAGGSKNLTSLYSISWFKEKIRKKVTDRRN